MYIIISKFKFVYFFKFIFGKKDKNLFFNRNNPREKHLLILLVSLVTCLKHSDLVPFSNVHFIQLVKDLDTTQSIWLLNYFNYILFGKMDVVFSKCSCVSLLLQHKCLCSLAHVTVLEPWLFDSTWLSSHSFTEHWDETQGQPAWRPRGCAHGWGRPLSPRQPHPPTICCKHPCPITSSCKSYYRHTFTKIFSIMWVQFCCIKVPIEPVGLSWYFFYEIPNNKNKRGPYWIEAISLL